jgi:protein-S-isoprenylcysteine O-methyltransferase Ste14
LVRRALPIYLAALLIVSGEAWLLLSADLLIYTAVLAIGFHLLVICYEEPALRARFGGQYGTYRHTVRRRIPRAAGPWRQPGC